MPDVVADLWVNLNANASGFLSSMAASSGAALGFEGSVGKGIAGLAKLGVGTAAVGAIVAAAAVKMAMDYDTSMTKVQALTGATTAEMAQLNAGVMKLAPTVGQSPKALADALYFIESAGFHGAAALDVLTYSAKAAAAGLGTTKVVADAVTSTVTAYASKGMDAKHATDALVAAVTQGKMPAEDLAGALGRVIGTSAALNVSFPQILANIATLTRTGMSASQAATSVQSIETALVKMLNPSKSIKSALDELHLSGTQLAQDMGSKGLYYVLTEITHAAGGNDAALVKLFPNVRALRDVLSTAGVQGQNYADILAKIQGASNGAGATQTAFAITQQNFHQQIKQIVAQMDVWLIQLGNKLIPYLQQGIRFVQEFTQWLGKHKDVAMALGVALGTVLVAGLVAATAATIAWTAALVTNPVFLIVVAIAALVAGLVYAYNHWKWFKDIVDGVWQWIAGTLWPGIKGFADWLATAFNVALAWVVQAWQDASKFIQKEVAFLEAWWHDHMASIMAVARVVWQYISTVIKLEIDIVVAIIKTALSVIQAMWHDVWTAIVDILRGVWIIIKSVVDLAIHTVMDVIGIWLDILTGKWGQAWKDLKDLVSHAFTDILAIITQAGTQFFNAGVHLIEALAKGVVAAAGGLASAVGNAISGAIKSAGPFGGILSAVVGHNAAGTSNWRGGPTWVGENGPEIVNLPRGSQVIPAGQSARGAGGNTVTVHQTFNTPMDPFAVGREVAWALKTA